jgi:hypothetical protein
MALSDIEANLTGVVPWRTCAVCHHLSERDDAWGTQLRRLLANRGVKFHDLAKELADDPTEPDIPAVALSRHARGLCVAKEVLR